jgi:uncharacterized membrane protein
VWKSLVSWVLGIERGRLAQGTGMRLRFATPWPTWVIFLFAALAAWLVFALYRREKGTATPGRKRFLAVLRLAIAAIVVVVLAKPILVADKSELKQAYVVFLLDDSLSMKIRDRYQDPETLAALARASGLAQQPDGWVRADLVNGVLTNPELDLFGPLEGRCKLTVANFADTVRGLRREAWKLGPGETAALVTPQGERTLLGAALRQVAEGLRGHRIAAMVVVTDGRAQDTDPTAVETARGLAALHAAPFPVFTVGVGTMDERRDIQMVRVLGPNAARKDDQVTLNAVVTTQGFEGEVDVLVHREKELVATVRTRLAPAEGPQTVPITFTPATEGSFEYRVSIPVQPDETNVDNNLARHPLTVKDQKSKLLLVSAQPTYFYRYLKNALLVDQSVELSCILQSADPDFHQEGNVRITHYPETRKELFAYDVVVFADVDPGAFRAEQLDDLKAFVGQFGGGFIFVAGQLHPVDAWAGTPVEELLPVLLTGTRAADPLDTRTLREPFQVRLTEQGRGHGITRLADTEEETREVWGNFPGCYWYAPVARAKLGSLVLAEHPYDRDEQGPMPLIVVGRYDPGRTLFCGLDGTWRWRFWVGDVHFNRFWVQAANFVGTYRVLGAGGRVQLATDREAYTLGDRVVVQAQVLDDSYRPAQDDALEAKIEMQGAEPRPVRLVRSRHSPGVFEGSFQADDPGAGMVTLALGSEQDSRSFSVTLPQSEFQHTTMDVATLEGIAAATQAQFLRLHEINQLADRIEAAGQEVTTEIQDPVFDAPLIVLLFLSIVCTEWWLRKRGMLA